MRAERWETWDIIAEIWENLELRPESLEIRGLRLETRELRVERDKTGDLRELRLETWEMRELRLKTWDMRELRLETRELRGLKPERGESSKVFLRTLGRLGHQILWGGCGTPAMGALVTLYFGEPKVTAKKGYLDLSFFYLKSLQYIIQGLTG